VSTDLGTIFKAYDIRGVVPDQLNESVAARVGAAFVALIREEEGIDQLGLVVGHDMRPSSPLLAEAFAEGAAAVGANVTMIGLASTDELYFASGSLGVPGAMFTASHNPAQYNGIKLCRAGAAPVGQESGLRQIAESVASALSSSEAVPPSSDRGRIDHVDMLQQYAQYLRSLVDLSGIRPLKVVADAGNGMAGLTTPAVFAGLPIELVEMYFELDGTFPNHEANPIEPENLKDLQAAVVRENADIGLAFDGDADRCFVVDEQGGLVSPSVLTALIAARELKREPGSTIIHNLITSATVPEVVTELGGTPVRTRVGHSYIKQVMAETGAVFGGEHSGHFYFRDFWRADSGMLAAMHTLAELGATSSPLSALLDTYNRYAASGEVNSTVRDQVGTIDRIRESWSARPNVETDELDGLTVAGDGWWFNVRASNTEPLLRLNVEARTAPQMQSLRDEVLAQIREEQP